MEEERKGYLNGFEESRKEGRVQKDGRKEGKDIKRLREVRRKDGEGSLRIGRTGETGKDMDRLKVGRKDGEGREEY